MRSGGALNLQVDVGDAYFKALAARQTRHAAEQGLAAQRQETLVRAAQAYFDLLVAQAVVGVAADALQISQDYESQLHRAVDAGIALKGDELRVRVQARRNQLSLQQATEQRRILAARLAEPLRLDPAVELVAQDLELAPLALVPATETVETLVSEALAARPEFKEAQALVQVAEQTREGRRRTVRSSRRSPGRSSSGASAAARTVAPPPPARREITWPRSVGASGRAGSSTSGGSARRAPGGTRPTGTSRS